jgi:hypothetical protein
MLGLVQLLLTRFSIRGESRSRDLRQGDVEAPVELAAHRRAAYPTTAQMANVVIWAPGSEPALTPPRQRTLPSGVVRKTEPDPRSTRTPSLKILFRGKAVGLAQAPNAHAAPRHRSRVWSFETRPCPRCWVEQPSTDVGALQVYIETKVG